MRLPLEGLRIVAVEQYGAGPFGTQHLADLGAEVIKVENPHDGGDVGRSVGPYFFAPGDSHFYEAFNRNKRSLALDLKSERGKEIFHDLVRTTDVVFNNLRGDLPEKLGLTYGALKHLNPAIVCGHLSAYGRSGSRVSWPGYDYLMQAEAGYLSVTGEPDGPPSRMGLSIIDFMAGITAMVGVLGAVVGARATGNGRDVDVSLYDVAINNLNYVAAWYLNEGKVVVRESRSSHPSLTPSQLYRTADGWIFLMCNKEKFWRVLVEAIDRLDWTTDPRYCDYKARLANRAELTGELDAIFGSASTEEWIARLAGKVPVAPVFDVAQALDNPFAAEQGRIVTVKHPERGTIRMLASPIRLPQSQERIGIAPALGADTNQILRNLGYATEEIEALRKDGII